MSPSSLSIVGLMTRVTLITFTLPAGLRAVARQHARTLYTFLFRASAAALQQLAHDPRCLGGQIGMIGVLQTWTRDMRFYLHVHYLVPALRLAPDGALRQPRNSASLVPAKPLVVLFRAKFQAALRQPDRYQKVPEQPGSSPGSSTAGRLGVAPQR
jgi:hypothetical protein